MGSEWFVTLAQKNAFMSIISISDLRKHRIQVIDWNLRYQPPKRQINHRLDWQGWVFGRFYGMWTSVGMFLFWDGVGCWIYDTSVKYGTAESRARVYLFLRVVENAWFPYDVDVTGFKLHIAVAGIDCWAVAKWPTAGHRTGLHSH